MASGQRPAASRSSKLGGVGTSALAALALSAVALVALFANFATALIPPVICAGSIMSTGALPSKPCIHGSTDAACITRTHVCHFCMGHWLAEGALRRAGRLLWLLAASSGGMRNSSSSASLAFLALCFTRSANVRLPPVV